MEMVNKESLGNSSRVRVPNLVGETPAMVVRNNNVINNDASIIMETYRECLNNHAINHGGHALDGCGEFLPSGPGGSLDALKCVVCNCHRSFHRKEASLPPIVVAVTAHVPATIVPSGDSYPPYNNHTHQAAPTPQHMVDRFSKGLLNVTAPPSGGGKDHDNGGIGPSSNSKKRFRTKFTPEQKEKMKAFAERFDWRIQKQDDVVVQEFCNENGLKHQVLKVWMNNNKHTLGKRP